MQLKLKKFNGKCVKIPQRTLPTDKTRKVCYKPNHGFHQTGPHWVSEINLNLSQLSYFAIVQFIWKTSYA